MMRKIICLSFVVLLVVGCAVANADDHVHQYGHSSKDVTYIVYESISDSYHEKHTYTDKYCEICLAGPILHHDGVVVEQHSLIYDDYHNGDQEDHVYVEYCVYCDYRYTYLDSCDCPPIIWRRKQ